MSDTIARISAKPYRHASRAAVFVVLALAVVASASMREQILSDARDKYPSDTYLVRLVESPHGVGDAQTSARSELVHQLGQEWSDGLRTRGGEDSGEAWDPSALVRLDDQLVGTEGGLSYAVAYLRLSDASQALVSEYEAVAAPWRERMKSILTAPVRQFSPVWREGRYEHGVLVRKAMALVVVMSKEGKGISTASLNDVVARDDMHPYRGFRDDQKLWVQVEKRRAELLKQAAIQIDVSTVANQGRKPVSDAVYKGFASLGIRATGADPKAICKRGLRLEISGNPECRDGGMGSLCTYQAAVRLFDCASSETLFDGMLPEKPFRAAAAQGEAAARRDLYSRLDPTMVAQGLSDALSGALPLQVR